MIMKKKIVGIIAASMLFGGIVSAASLHGNFEGNQIVKVTTSANELTVDGVPAINYKGRTMVPIYMLRQLGATVAWDESTYSVDVTLPSSQAKQTNDIVENTKNIINLGGGGVTLINIEGSMTAITYFNAKTNYESDWNSMSSVFEYLSDIGSEYIRVVYTQNGSENIIEIKNSDFKDFVNGKFTDSELQNRWILSGPLFQSTNGTTTSNQVGSTSNFMYPELYSNNGKTFLGVLTSNQYDSDGVFNTYGDYGSKYSQTSIWNEYGDYGSKYSTDSAFNEYTSSPPIIVLNGKIVGYLTVNSTLSGAISPYGLLSW
jgi:hypothetical protein